MDEYTKYTDEQIVAGIARKDSKVVRYIYRAYFGMVERMVINMGGRPEETKDIFQEAMEILFLKIRDGQLSLTSSFSTYLYAICKNLKRHAIRKYREPVPGDRADRQLVSEPSGEDETREKMKALVNRHFGNLSQDCQKLLRMHFQKTSLDDITSAMGYSSEHYTADRKYKCKKSLIKRVRNDPDYKKLMDEL